MVLATACRALVSNQELITSTDGMMCRAKDVFLTRDDIIDTTQVNSLDVFTVDNNNDVN